jgi:hypothetical protein
MSKQDKELAKIFEAVRYTCDHMVLTEADVMGMIKRGAQWAKEKLAGPTKSKSINWDDVYKLFATEGVKHEHNPVTQFVNAPGARDKALIFDKLKRHPDVKAWSLENLTGPANTINKFKNNLNTTNNQYSELGGETGPAKTINKSPLNTTSLQYAELGGEMGIRKTAAKIILQAQKEIYQAILPLVRDAEVVVKRYGMTLASKLKENKEIQDIAKIITEDIRTNNGTILENQWDVPFPQPNFRSAVFREFFEFLEQKGINPPVAVVGAGDLSRKEGRAIRYLNSLVSEFLGIDRENDIKPPPSSFMKSGKGY